MRRCDLACEFAFIVQTMGDSNPRLLDTQLHVQHYGLREINWCVSKDELSLSLRFKLLYYEKGKVVT